MVLSLTSFQSLGFVYLINDSYVMMMDQVCVSICVLQVLKYQFLVEFLLYNYVSLL